MTELTLRLEPPPEAAPSKLAPEVEAALRATLNLRIPVETVPVETLPRFELKAQRWLRE